MATNLNISTNTTEVSSRDNSITITDNNTGNIVNISQQDTPTVTISAAGIAGGRDFLGDNVSFQHITASGEISASGIVYGSQISIGGGIFTSASLAAAEASGDNLGNHTATQDINLGGNNIFGILNITSSGNISSSGAITASSITAVSGAFQHITASVLDVDASTIRIGGTSFAKTDLDALRAGQSIPQTAREGFTNRFQPEAIFGKHDTDYIKFTTGHRIGTFISGTLFHDMNLTGSNNYFAVGKDSNTQLRLTGQITASGNISASGTIVGSNLSGTNTGDQDLSGFATTGSNITFANVTSSGNISSSKNIIGNQITASDATITNILTVKHLKATTVSTLSITSSIVTSSIIFSSGSTKFGDEILDTHTFIGNITASGNVKLNEFLKLNVNNKFIQGKKTGGTTHNILGINDSDVVQVSNENTPTEIKGSSITLSAPITSSIISASKNIIGPTGSFSKTVITLKSGTEDSPFLIKIANSNGQDEKLQMTKDGVLRFGALNALPTAITGGLVYSSSAFYMGL